MPCVLGTQRPLALVPGQQGRSLGEVGKAVSRMWQLDTFGGVEERAQEDVAETSSLWVCGGTPWKQGAQDEDHNAFHLSSDWEVPNWRCRQNAHAEMSCRWLEEVCSSGFHESSSSFYSQD